jgi:hypothetical protein
VPNLFDRLRQAAEDALRPWVEIVGSRIEQFESQVIVERRDQSVEETRIEIEHLLPETLQSGAGQLRFTTQPQYLSPKVFGSAAKTINSARGERGRSIFCIDKGDQSVLSAVAYHIDQKRLPILVRAFAVLPSDDPAHEVSVGTALVLKTYLHVLGKELGRGAHVDMNASRAEKDLVMRLGFRPAPVPSKFSYPVETYVRQKPLW